jgi:hypothetical protein
MLCGCAMATCIHLLTVYSRALALVLQLFGRERGDREVQADQHKAILKSTKPLEPSPVAAAPAGEGEAQLRQEREWDTHASMQVSHQPCRGLQRPVMHLDTIVGKVAGSCQEQQCCTAGCYDQIIYSKHMACQLST